MILGHVRAEGFFFFFFLGRRLYSARTRSVGPSFCNASCHVFEKHILLQKQTKELLHVIAERSPTWSPEDTGS